MKMKTIILWVHDFSDQSENKILTLKRLIGAGQTLNAGPPDFTKGKGSTELTELFERP